MHVERPVLVNAWVDEGVIPIVLALNKWAGIETIESCQDDGCECRPNSTGARG